VKQNGQKESVNICATTTTKTKVVKLRAEPESIGIWALKHIC